ncbi:MAG: sterol carrier family protein [Candidatus Nanopelagicaceae bacterium]
MNRDPEVMAQVKATLAELVKRAPGRAIEVRIPPYAAIQCGDGPTHTRGTPPNVIEMDAATWLSLASGEVAWKVAMDSGLISASGARADLSEYLPIGTAQ